MKSLPAPWSPTCPRRRCREPSNALVRTKIPPTPGTSRTRFPKICFSLTSAPATFSIAIWRKRYLEDDTYFGPLSQGNNVLPFEHAYSHVNAFSSAMQAYLTLGSEMHLRAARNGFDMLQTTQSFATGGWGPDEAFGEPGVGQLGNSLASTHASFETPCGAYGHFKITRYLLRVTKEAHYGDSMEQVLYNTILGAWPIQPDGTSFYYSDYNLTGKKGWHRDKWPCCSGTFPQLAADYHISTYLRASDGVYVNLYAPSTVRWSDSGGKYSLTQQTKYPFENTGPDPGGRQPRG